MARCRGVRPFLFFELTSMPLEISYLHIPLILFMFSWNLENSRCRGVFPSSGDAHMQLTPSYWISWEAISYSSNLIAIFKAHPNLMLEALKSISCLNRFIKNLTNNLCLFLTANIKGVTLSSSRMLMLRYEVDLSRSLSKYLWPKLATTCCKDLFFILNWIFQTSFFEFKKWKYIKKWRKRTCFAAFNTLSKAFKKLKNYFMIIWPNSSF